tara:strand:- start:120 stop:569 length:450 start_codon:yes stop_codon:yes gene_type:complete
MIIYIILGILITILLIFFINKLVNISKKKFKFFFKLFISSIILVIFIFLIRLNPQFIYGLPAFLLFLFRWRNLLIFIKRLIFPNNIQNNFAKNKMTRKEALEILGLDEGADKDQILKAYHDLLKKNHPDVGGSVWITSQLNKAKETLLD